MKVVTSSESEFGEQTVPARQPQKYERPLGESAMGEALCNTEPESEVIQDASERLRALDQSPLPLWIYDFDRLRIHWANDAALVLWEASSLTQLQRRDLGADMTPMVRRRLEQYRSAFVHGQRLRESWTFHPEGRPTTHNCAVQGIALGDGRLAMLVQVLGESAEDSDTLRSVQALLHTSVMITLFEEQGELLYCNPAARSSLPDGVRSIQGRIVVPAVHTELLERLSANGEWDFEAQVRTRTGQNWHSVTARRSLDAVTGKPTILVSEHDISARKRTEVHAERLTFHDALTGLANRALLQRALDEAVDADADGPPAFSLMFIDLDNFKTINDSLGHAQGDDLLCQVATRLQELTYDSDTIARLGGDEFVVIMRHAKSRQEASAAASRVLAALNKSYIIGERELHASASIGISMFPNDGLRSNALMKNADLAMYEAKSTGRNCYRFFRRQLRLAADNRLDLEHDLRRAIRNKEFELYYQPRVGLQGGRIVTVEALLRWHHPTRGLLAPGAFLELAEESGLITPIGDWVLERSCQQLARWQARGKSIGLAINLSARQFRDEGFVASVDQHVQHSGIDPRGLELEITESMLMAEADDLRADLAHFHDQGMTIAVDDFGTGYSNLAYLQTYPIDCLKVDRRFIRDGENMAIPEMIIAMARLLELTTVVEGVETVRQLQWAKSRRCDQYQGHLFSRPVAVDELNALIGDRKT